MAISNIGCNMCGFPYGVQINNDIFCTGHFEWDLRNELRKAIKEESDERDIEM